MRIHLYAPCWNDEAMLPYFYRHYDDIVDQYYIYDDGSTDRSLEILAGSKKTVTRRLEHKSDAYCFDSCHIWENAWKQNRSGADWVIACNLDEHLYHPNLLEYLKDCHGRGFSVLPAAGYQMLSQEYPTFDGRLSDHLHRGTPEIEVTKTMVFRPDMVESMRFSTGRHSCDPTGSIRVPRRPELKILHFKHLGYEYVLKRHAELAARLREGDRTRSMGIHYHRTPEKLRDFFATLERGAIDVRRDDAAKRLRSILPRTSRIRLAARRVKRFFNQNADS